MIVMPSLIPLVIISQGVARHDRFIRREPRHPELHQRKWRRRRYHTASSATAAAAPPSPPPLSRSRPPAASEAIIIVALYGGATRHDGIWLRRRHAQVACDGRGGDSDAAAPDIWNGPQERLGASAGVNSARWQGNGKRRRLASGAGISASPGSVGECM